MTRATRFSARAGSAKARSENARKRGNRDLNMALSGRIVVTRDTLPAQFEEVPGALLCRVWTMRCTFRTQGSGCVASELSWWDRIETLLFPSPNRGAFI